jgi:hypothetical protein
MTATTDAQTTTARPWDSAADWSMWEITGKYPTKPGYGRHSFTACLAVVAARYTHGINRPLFLFIGPLGDINEPVDPDWITDARPLLLVAAADPTQAYWQHDQAVLDVALAAAPASPVSPAADTEEA